MEQQELQRSVLQKPQLEQEEIKQRKRFGYQTIKNPDNGEIYEGQLGDNLYDGDGMLFYPNKCYFQGLFRDGHKVKGFEIYPNGDEYEGDYLNNKWHGDGVLQNCRQKYKYDGTFTNGKREGQGKERYKSGAKYDGEFKSNMKEGKGKFIYPNSSYYEGQFRKGMKQGYGIFVQFLKQQNLQDIREYMKGSYVAQYRKNMSEAMEKRKELLEQEERKKKEKELEKQQQQQQVELNHESENEADELEKQQQIQEAQYDVYFEGEFIEGRKHGIGRQYNHNGSYFYGIFQNDMIIGECIYYSSDNHNWKKCYVSWKCNYDSVEKILAEGEGNPPLKIDGYKSLIDECGVKTLKIEDPYFEPSPKSLSMGNIQTEITNDIMFQRIPEIFAITDENYEYRLFTEEIKPGQFELEELCNPQVIVCLEVLTYYPHLIQKICTPKFNIGKLGYITMKLYIQRSWKEIVIDDFFPCNMKTTKTILATTQNNDIGYLLLQKLIYKELGGYMIDTSAYQLAESILEMLTSLPCKVISSEKSTTEKFTKHIQNYFPYKVKIFYLTQKSYQENAIPQNFPFILESYSNKLLVCRSLNQKFKLQGEWTYEKIASSELQKLLKKLDTQKSDSYFFLSIKEFLNNFDKLYILVGTQNDYVQNFYPFSVDTQQLINLHQFDVTSQFSINFKQDRRYISFKIPIYSKVLINVQQIAKAENKVLPVRIILAKISEVQKKKKNKEAMDGNTKNIGKFDYQYIFGKGQSLKKNTFKFLNNTILLIKKRVDARKWLIHFISLIRNYQRLSFSTLNNEQNLLKKIENLFQANVFSDFLLSINEQQERPKFEQFFDKVYQSCILKAFAERKAEKVGEEQNQKKQGFYYANLSNAQNGDRNLIILQYFLKSEGTYIEYLWNNTSNKSWRQKLTFSTQKMRMLNSFTSKELDLTLLPKENKIVILQQIQGAQYSLEGGEGICIITDTAEKQGLQQITEALNEQIQEEQSELESIEQESINQDKFHQQEGKEPMQIQANQDQEEENQEEDEEKIRQRVQAAIQKVGIN